MIADVIIDDVKKVCEGERQRTPEQDEQERQRTCEEKAEERPFGRDEQDTHRMAG